ncbi:MAG TPA: hypothetical protein VJ600_03955 [Holophagaceae bacterium]|nr:hypothetical protein [Holophagaceae bacterium]
MSREPRLRPLGAAGGRSPFGPDADTRAEAQLRPLWAFAVGPLLARRTRLMKVKEGRLVVGCWELSHIPNLRLAAEQAWPTVRERLARVLGLRLSGFVIVPCDPPEETVEAPATTGDPLRDVLERLKSLNKP